MALQYAPVLGACIKGEKAFVAIRQSCLTCKIVRTTSNAIETVKKTGVVRYGSELVFTTKQAVEKLGAQSYNKIQDAVYRLEKSGVVINFGTKNSIAQAFSELPDGYALAIANSTDDLDSAVYKMVKNSGSQTADEMGEILQKEVKDGELAKVVGKSEGGTGSNNWQRNLQNVDELNVEQFKK